MGKHNGVKSGAVKDPHEVRHIPSSQIINYIMIKSYKWERGGGVAGASSLGAADLDGRGGALDRGAAGNACNAVDDDDTGGKYVVEDVTQ